MLLLCDLQQINSLLPLSFYISNRISVDCPTVKGVLRSMDENSHGSHYHKGTSTLHLTMLTSTATKICSTHLFPFHSDQNAEERSYRKPPLQHFQHLAHKSKSTGAGFHSDTPLHTSEQCQQVLGVHNIIRGQLNSVLWILQSLKNPGLSMKSTENKT